ncbi:Hypothetical protein R9X50_00670700 [Acrodontium crateriforme]|uniref:Uncharacterized protein n=1 Tax=Acrodontium crateriforme TaxID=150365 RepID=A0AAQ3RA47_9PEZI|nr:Hypothetical protein R9X50_00670700 [Acrodontium crateriforme]
MGPLKEHVFATVRSMRALHRGDDPKVIRSDPFGSMDWFINMATDYKIDDKGPPAKRRKKNGKLDDPTVAAEEIPLYMIDIDLYFPLKSDARVDHDEILADIDFDEADGSQVTILGIENDGSLINVSSIADPESKLTIEIDQLPKSSCDALVHISQLHSTEGSRTSQNNTSRQLCCYLHCSLGSRFKVVRLTVSYIWRSGFSAFPEGMPVGRRRLYPEYDELLRFYPDLDREETDHKQPWSPRDFYDRVHVPPKSQKDTEKFNDILANELFPFQKRAVSWLLRREGVVYESGQIQTIPPQSQTCNFYKQVQDANGKACYVNHLQGIISRQQPLSDRTLLCGGLLAEEMGLGKTVELMALISLHKRPEKATMKLSDKPSNKEPTPSKATLIITPTSILQQWESELSHHAPHLRVHVYDGIAAGSKKSKSDSEVIEDLSTKYDVVLATYNTIGKELHFTEDPPDRNMRHARRFERKRSVLVQIHWWRICLDEAQLVENGVTTAARVASRLPRANSWAVSGTPLKKNIEDLHGLLIFLKYQPLNDSSKLWRHLITNHKHLFRRLFGQIALRHTKAHVRDELQLPLQKRVVITMPFSSVEQQHYETMFADMCREVGLDHDGSPSTPMVGWVPDNYAEVMRMWLTRLRQTCLHPEVGGRNRRALGRGQGRLRTVAEVLEVMIEQNETNLRTEERAYLATQLLRGHILGYNREDERRSEKALEIYLEVQNKSLLLVREARERLDAAKEALDPKMKSETDSDGEESDSESTPLLGRLRNNLRTALELQHVCTFFAATMYFQIKSNETLTQTDSEKFKELEEKEVTLYDEAKIVRRELLSQSSRKAEALMRKIGDLTRKGTMTSIPAIKQFDDLGGIESRRLIEKSDDLFDLIKQQTAVIVEWRAKMAEFLVKPLVDEDQGKDEITGDEYEDSTKQQDELYVYFDAVKAMQADLTTMITGESAPLIDHEVKNLIRDAKWFLDPEIEFKSVVHAPELALQLLATRNKYRNQLKEVGSIRGLIQEARSLENSLDMQNNSRALSERGLVQKYLQGLQRVFKEYSKALSGLEKELDLFRNTQNQRLEFYRQLQALSDAVAPYKEELDEKLDLDALQNIMAKEEQQSASLAQLKTKNRFLLHLREESGCLSEQKVCVICRDTFENGVLTVCGHQYCKECIRYWWQLHRSCPVCKRRLALHDFHNITYKPQELKAQQESSSETQNAQNPEAGTSTETSIYSDIDDKLLSQIKSIDLPCSYGTKIDALGRHLMWIREQDPGAKSIVFSQYREFLDVLGTALKDFKIGHSRLGRAGAVEKFRQDPSVDCLLLDAKTDSSGLTLVNATNVFFCEPLIQTAVELQAIARVHRIGQTRLTTVWMYLIKDTVEESIYDVSVARRLAHVQSKQVNKIKSGASTPRFGVQEGMLDAVNSEEMQSAMISKLLVAGKGGGEVVGNEDLWQCLFGKAQAGPQQQNPLLDAEVGRHLRAEAAETRRQV